jgi:putative heme-binding domain-containing protein
LTFADQKEQVDLRALGRCGSFTTADWWKIKQNSDESKKLKALLVSALDSPDEKISTQAAYYLSLLREKIIDADLQLREAKRNIARVKARNVSQTITRAWVVGPISFGLIGDRDRFPENGPIDLSAPYGRPNDPKFWTQTDLAKVKLELDEAGPFAYVYFRIQSSRRQTMVFPDLGPPLWHNGVRVRSLPDVEMHVVLEPGSNDILACFSKVPKSIKFQVEERVSISMPDKLDGAELAKRLRDSAKSGDKIPSEFLTVNWLDGAKRGDAANGRRLFGALACAKCHAIAAGQAGGGAPSLTDIKKRFTVPHVVESILLPSKQVAEPFRASRIELKSGQSISGLIVAEQADQIEVLLPDATRKTIAKKEIEERTITPTSPMPAGLVKTPQELRDLLAYLFSDNPLPP